MQASKAYVILCSLTNILREYFCIFLKPNVFYTGCDVSACNYHLIYKTHQCFDNELLTLQWIENTK